MDDDVEMEEDEDAEKEDITQVVMEIKPPDASAPMKIVNNYTPKGMFL